VLSAAKHDEVYPFTPLTEQKLAVVAETSLISLPRVIAANSNITKQDRLAAVYPWPVFVWLNRRRSLFTDHCPIWHSSGWMALCLEAIVFILPPGDALAIAITMEVLTTAAQRERWRDRQSQGGGENDGTQ
jgi:hypothetical protein